MIDYTESEDSPDVEVSGYLQKKTSKGLYSSRFFSTQGRYLKYWPDKTKFDVGTDASETFDLCEVKHFEKQGNKSFCIYFMNDKFKLELRAASDQNCTEWHELLLAKRSLHSVSELLADLNNASITFKTKMFQDLMVLKERDQNKWVLDRLDEMFRANAPVAAHHCEQVLNQKP